MNAKFGRYGTNPVGNFNSIGVFFFFRAGGGMGGTSSFGGRCDVYKKQT